MEKEIQKNEIKKFNKQELAENMGIIVPKNITDKVMNSLEISMKDDRLHLPKNFSLPNAMKSAYLKLQETVDKTGQPVLKSCTETSIVNSLLFTALSGLTCSKDQIYYIAYRNVLKPMVSVFGNIAISQRMSSVEGPPIAKMIYKGDKVDIGENELGEEVITKHERTWDSRMTNEITAAYATIQVSGIVRSAIMTMPEILESWSKSKTDKEHKLHRSEFVKRTIINRLLKPIIKSSDDSDLAFSAGSSDGSFDKTNVVDDDTGEVDMTPKEIEDSKKELQETTIKEGQFEEVAEPVKEEINVVIKDPKPEGEKPITRMVNGKQQEMDF
jgi:recombination protein RecT